MSNQYIIRDKFRLVVTKEDVGLSNVDNTSDMDKPVSRAQLAAIAAGGNGDGDGDGATANVMQALTDAPIIAWDFSLGNIATVTLNGNRSLSITNVAAGQTGILIVTQGGTGGKTLTVIGETPSIFRLSSNVGGQDVLGFIYNGITFFWDYTNYGEVGDILQDVAFFTFTGLINTAGIWTCSIGGAWGAYGIGDRKLATGTNGYIQVKYLAADMQNAMYSFNDREVDEPYNGNHYMAGMIFGVNTVATISGATIGGFSGAIAVGDYVRIERTGSTFKLRKSTDLVNWTELYTFPYTSSAEHFVHLNLEASVAPLAKIYYPKIFNSVPR